MTYSLSAKSPRYLAQTQVYISEFAMDLTDGNNEDANKDYSVTPAEFVLAPPVGSVWNIARLLFFLEDFGSLDADKYGNGLVLTNGVTIQVKRGDTVLCNLTNSQPIKSNSHWKKFCFDVESSAYGTGNQTLGSRWTFAKSGSYIHLVGDLGDKIVVTLNDDFSGLVSHTFLFQGHKQE